MRITKFVFLAVPVFCLLTVMGPILSYADENAPQAREVVAVVNGEEIYLDELDEAVAARHRDISEDTSVAWVGYTGALDRLINAKLVIQEALDVGLDERPESREKVRRYQDQTLTSLLKRSRLSGIEPDKEEVERLYREEIRLWKFGALAFKDLEQARAFRGELETGAGFELVGERYVQEGLAAWEGSVQEVREADISPQISAGFAGKEVGSFTSIIQAVDRFFVFQLTGVSYPDDPAARKKAVRQALIQKRKEILQKFIDELMEKYVSVDQDVLAGIGKGEFTDIEKDTRVAAEVTGEDPVLVADLFLFLQGKAYHGGKASEHIEALESDPAAVLWEALEKRLYLKEARETGIDSTARYEAMMVDYEDSLLFGMYIEEFLVPQAQVSEKEVRAAYEKRSHELLLPQKVQLDVLLFNDAASAEKALKSLREGADVKWLGENAAGLKAGGVTREELVPDNLTPELQNLFSGARQGDTGLYEAGDGTYRVFLVRDLPPRDREPFESARARIARELFDVHMNKAIADLTAELRELSEITIYKEKLDQGPVRQDRDSK